MKKWLFILFPFWCFSQSYVVPNINAKGIMANVCDDTLKISSLNKIKRVDIWNKELHFDRSKSVDGHTYNLPLTGIPNGKHTMTVIQNRKMYTYWIIIGRLESDGHGN